MSARDPRVDAYIARSAAFAQPILSRLRDLVHEACPEVEETLKWGAPSFMHAGGILCFMAAFKQHASFGFWKHALVLGEDVPREGMGSLGKKQLLAWIRKAALLNAQGARTPAVRKAGRPKPQPDVPPELAAALAMRKHARARAVFEAFPPGHRREYIEWIAEAKREETRARRLAQALEWMSEGKPRNWKYMRC
jgi:uncharacterized protein YdeI (YjbR/CyaY-like superfamily)